jgi:hypothetical protein
MFAPSSGPFVPPTDPEYVKLKSHYSFNHQALRSQFLAVSNRVNFDNTMLAKQHNLNLFREAFQSSVPLPRELFWCEPPVANVAQEAQALKTVVLWTTSEGRYDLSTELSKIYPGLSWIAHYFVMSTFPSTFGHFLSAEYLEYGLRFLQSHIHDPLAPRLVGTYLLHCFIFRDRLMQSFFQLSSSSGECDVMELFLKAFAFCISYFSEFHVGAVKTLRRVSESAAVEAVINHFLIPTVRLWSFHPLFATTNLIQKRQGRATNYRSIEYSTFLLDALLQVRNDPARTATLLDLFVDDISIETPKISAVILYGGVKFPLTVVDVTIIQQLYELLKSITPNPPRPREVHGNVETAHTDAFKFRANFCHYLPATVSEPAPTETSPHLTRRKLQEHKAMHDFLYGIAGGLNHFDSIAVAERAINALSYRALARSIFLADGCTTQPAQFASFQRARYSMQLFSQFAVGVFRDYVQRQTPGDFNDFHQRRLITRINAAIVGGTAPATAIVCGTLDYVNEWKERYNADNPTAQQGTCQMMKDDLPFCSYFADAVDQLTLAFVMNRLSDCPNPIVAKSPKARATPVEMLRSNLAATSLPTPFSRYDVASLEDDLEITTVLELREEVKFLLPRAEESARMTFEAGDHAYGIGDWITFFIELEALMRPLMLSEIAVAASFDNPDWPLKLMTAIFRGKDPIHLRGWLFQARMVVTCLKAVKSSMLDDLDTIRHPITDEIIEAFGNLWKWFGFKAPR